MKRLLILPLLALAACGTDKIEAQSDVTPPAETATPTTEMPKPADGIAEANERCTGVTAGRAFAARYDEVGEIYVGTGAEVAAEDGITLDAFIQQVLAEMYDADEATLDISGAYLADDEYGLTELGLLSGIVWDCVQTALDVPTRVLEHVASTRALDGQQTDTWDDFSARWTYHPDDGLNITIWES